MKFSSLVGETIKNIENKNNEELIFTLDNGDKFKLYHDQDCCESVEIEDICGDLNDICGSPILVAEESVSENETPPGLSVGPYEDTYTWTFYKIDTARGGVTIRWFGSSNGYYSESVDFCKIN